MSGEEYRLSVGSFSTDIYLYFNRITYIISEDVQINTIVFSKVLTLSWAVMLAFSFLDGHSSTIHLILLIYRLIHFKKTIDDQVTLTYFSMSQAAILNFHFWLIMLHTWLFINNPELLFMVTGGRYWILSDIPWIIQDVLQIYFKWYSLNYPRCPSNIQVNVPKLLSWILLRFISPVWGIIKNKTRVLWPQDIFLV